jgi:hypothetical protein
MLASMAQVRQGAQLNSRGTQISRDSLDCSEQESLVSSRDKIIQSGGKPKIVVQAGSVGTICAHAFTGGGVRNRGQGRNET